MRKRHIPMRSCVGCHSSFPKRDLMRVVRNPEGKAELDLTGKRSGRGAYLCRSEECLKKAVQGKQLERALGVPVGSEVLEEIKRVVHEQDL